MYKRSLRDYFLLFNQEKEDENNNIVMLRDLKIFLIILVILSSHQAKFSFPVSSRGIITLPFHLEVFFFVLSVLAYLKMN